MRGKNKYYNILWELISPPRCVICEKLISLNEGICGDCREKLPFIGEVYCLKCGKTIIGEGEYCGDCRRKKHYFTRNVALWEYSPKLKNSLYRFKYNNKKYYAKYYASELERRYSRLIKDWKIEKIIPVPMFRKKEKRRGYNQAQLLAKELSKRLNIPLDSKTIVRTKNTVPLKKLNESERKKNLKGAFKINKSVVELEKVLLIDDIYTTGSTVDEISRELLKKGVSSVYVLTLCIGRGY